MSWYNKVIWSEGMFLRPQHFQQHDRYLAAYVEQRCNVLRAHAWGLKELQLDRQLLTLGKIGISVARGVFPDGTPFNIPDDDEPPSPIDVPEDCREAIVFLGLPARRQGGMEVVPQDKDEGLGRFSTSEYEVRDAATGNDNVAPVQVGKLRPRLLLESDKREEYVCIGTARIIEVKADKHVILDDRYLQNVIDCQASEPLAGFMNELKGLLHHRGEALAGRVTASGKGGAAEIADFMLLQTVNRYQPLISHLASLRGLHPESFYRIALEMAGELATFTSSSKRSPEFESYRHEDLNATFEHLIRELRQSLSMVLEQNAIPLPLQERKFGIYVSPITDRKLLLQAAYVLAVSAEIPAEDLRSRFRTQVKIGPVEKIRELVNLALPGIQVRPLPVAPRQIPFHSGYAYFELERASEYWKEMQNSGGFAIHVGGDFPGLQMQFWAIKS